MNMATLTGGQAAVEALKAEGTRYVFGLIGSATMEIFDALYDADTMTFIGVHDERTGAHMADGYARATGKAGVVLAGQNGPGATNLVTGQRMDARIVVRLDRRITNNVNRRSIASLCEQAVIRNQVVAMRPQHRRLAIHHGLFLSCQLLEERAAAVSNMEQGK